MPARAASDITGHFCSNSTSLAWALFREVNLLPSICSWAKFGEVSLLSLTRAGEPLMKPCVKTLIINAHQKLYNTLISACNLTKLS